MKQHMNGLALGELGIVSGPRNTQNGKKFNHLIKRATKQEVYIKNGKVTETVENCIELIGSHYREVEKLASLLKGITLKEICRNISTFHTPIYSPEFRTGTPKLKIEITQAYLILIT